MVSGLASMPVTINKVEDPCRACRERHLKCDNGDPKCKQCERLGEDCVREDGRHRWRPGSSAHYDKRFSKNQVWLGQTKHTRLQFVDQGPELENFYAAEDSGEELQKPVPPTYYRFNGHEAGAASQPFSGTDRSPSVRSTTVTEVTILSPGPSSIDSIVEQSSHKRQKTNDSPTSQLVPLDRDRPRSLDNDHSRFYSVRDSLKQSNNFSPGANTAIIDSHTERQRRVYAEYRRLEDTLAAEVPPEELLSPTVWKEHFIWPNDWTTTQCACLMRYYTDHLGPWLDIGDPARHFTLVVPQRARRCPPLLNAIFTIAARHLSRLARYKTNEGVVRYQNNLMPRLDDRQAIKYQNASIAYLKELCKTPEHLKDEDLLAATVILRYYEELDSSLGDDRDESIMRPFSLFVAAQAEPFFQTHANYTPLDFSIPGSFSSVRSDAEGYLKSYQRACIRIALRQECARAFMKQQAIGLPLEKWSMLHGFDEAEDIVWADRHLHHLAHVLQFCFTEDSQGQWGSKRWSELKSFEKQWEDNKPISFAAIHYKRPNLTTGDALPEIWYLAEIHAAATQYFDLARILLTVYNPTLPRLGPGATSAAKQMSADVRELVVELCGIARSMQDSEPALVQAYMAIALCGEHFTNRVEQKALMNILVDLESHHGFPTGHTKTTLKQAWSW